MVNYKVKKASVFLGYYWLKNLFKRKKKDHELSEVEKEFIHLWKEKVADKKNELFLKKIDGLSKYHVFDYAKKVYMYMLSDFEDSKIELISNVNGIVIKQEISVTKVITERLIKSFEHEIDTRCEKIAKELNETLMQNIKELHTVKEPEENTKPEEPENTEESKG